MRGVEALLLLGDGRFPAGGHAHSGGVEAAVLAGAVADVDGLARYLVGRLHTQGLVDAAVAAAAADGGDVAVLDAEAAARTASPALRASSRSQGAQLLRAGRVAWTVDCTLRAPMLAVALGVVARAAGVDAAGAAALACHHALTGPAGAAVRLLGLDPFAAHAAVAALAPEVDVVVAAAMSAAGGDRRDLPAATGLVPELAADAHAAHPEALFAS